MSGAVSGSELINIAIDIEKRGISFYDVMAKSTDDESTRQVFQGLVAMEREHIHVFRGMLDSFNDFELSDSVEEDRSDYLRALVDSAVFTTDLISSEMAAQADTDIKALELAIDAEKDSILFYYELRDIMPHNVAQLLSRIIAEEKSHLRQLSEIKSGLS